MSLLSLLGWLLLGLLVLRSRILRRCLWSLPDELLVINNLLFEKSINNEEKFL
jgi:hypothetical protein